MRTLLTLEKRSRDGRLRERRRQHVRSFTQNLMELLYLAHAQITAAAPRQVTDVRGGIVAADSERYANSYGRNQLANLLVASPGGNAQVWVGGEGYYSSSNVVLDPSPQTLLPGELIGIQIGSGDSPVTPQDTRLASRIPHGNRGPVTTPQTLEAVLTGDTTSAALDSAAWRGFYWIPTRQMTVTSIRLLMYRSGTPGTLNYHFKPAGLRGTGLPPDIASWNVLATASTNGDTLPTGAPYEWREFVLSPPVTVVPGLGYVFWGTRAGSGSAYRRTIGTSGCAYANPRTVDTAEGGSTWYSQSPLYDIRGTAPREIEYGACEVTGLRVTNPTAEFLIRRLFTNRSGGDVTVAECGIYAGCSWRPGYGSSFPLCICRDVIDPPLVVGDGEVLAVSYTPQITV